MKTDRISLSDKPHVAPNMTLDMAGTLEWFCTARRGMGFAVTRGMHAIDRHIYAALVTRGFLERLECAGQVIYRATEDGRTAYNVVRKANGWRPWKGRKAK